MGPYTVGTILRSKPREGIDPVTEKPYEAVRREITAVRDFGYTWKYPEFGEKTPSGADNQFITENSNDPFMEFGWEVEHKPMRGGNAPLVHVDDACFMEESFVVDRTRSKQETRWNRSMIKQLDER